MSHSFANAPTRQMAELLKLNDQSAPAWPPEELGALLRHQLEAPLAFDLAAMADGGEKTVHAMTATVTLGQPPRTFADALFTPAAPLELLALMKDFFRAARGEGALPPEVATLLYYATIAAAWLHHRRRITELDEPAIQKGIDWSLAQTWLDPRIKKLLQQSESTPPAQGDATAT